jgi:predicted RNA binding protein YcfA (HicA-like mRNA interferase family)
MGNDNKKLIKDLESQGFTVEPTKNGHYTVRKDGKRVATLAGTPSDRRSWLNSLSHLRRAGFIWPH